MMAMMSAACCYFVLSLDALYGDVAYIVRELKQEYIPFIMEKEVRTKADTLYFYAVAYR